jgi:hypothetical protein
MFRSSKWASAGLDSQAPSQGRVPVVVLVLVVVLLLVVVLVLVDVFVDVV